MRVRTGRFRSDAGVRPRSVVPEADPPVAERAIHEKANGVSLD